MSSITEDSPIKEETIVNAKSESLDVESIYAYYQQSLIPAILQSLPLLGKRIASDSKMVCYDGIEKMRNFLIPWKQNVHEWSELQLPSSRLQRLPFPGRASFVEFLLRNFDADQDGHISASELYLHIHNSSIHFPNLYQLPDPPQTLFTWFQRSWPLMDWKLGVFLWRSCGGLLLLIALCTIIPGWLHGLSGRILRWPILGLTYFMIMVELAVYTIIRLFIRLVESIFSTPKHRLLRQGMAEAKSYDEWYTIAKELDISQDRDKWQNTIDDDISFKYNWIFIRELMSDLRTARQTNDLLLALTVLRHCTRQNVGGMMNEELFSYTYTGEPKNIVKNFIDEVVDTLEWLTETVKSIPTSKLESNLNNNESKGNCVQNECTEKNKKANEESDTINLQVIENNAEKKLLSNVVGSVSDASSIAMRWIFNGVEDKGIPLTNKNSVKVAKSIYDKNPIELKENKGGIEFESSCNPQRLLPKTESELKLIRELILKQREQTKTFLKRARAAYGRTALCLSGGAMMGLHHFGHVKSLLAENVLPYIISGTSAGSVVAAFLCTRNEEELKSDLCPKILAPRLTCFSKTWPDRIRNFRKKGCLFDSDDWFELIHWFTCGNLTFEEAFQKTGRVLCITLCATNKKAPPVLINYISAPNVTIASAVVASAAVPYFISPIVLQVKGPDGIVKLQAENKDQSYWDGSINQDIPMSSLAEVLNCQFIVAAQCNPHIVPFFYNSKGDVGRPSRWSRGLKDDSWRGGFLLAAWELYLKSDMKAKFHFLNDLEAAVGFTSTMMTQVYGGSTTIVPQVSFKDYFKLFSDPTEDDMKRYFQVGSVAAYPHCVMMKLHYSISHALDKCLAILEKEDGSMIKHRRRSKKIDNYHHLKESIIDIHDDEYETGGFDGVHFR